MEINQVNMLLDFVLLTQSMTQFPFVYHVTFCFDRSYCRPIEASKFRVNAIHIKKQFCLHTVCVLEFKMKMQLRLGFNRLVVVFQGLPAKRISFLSCK